MSGELMPYVSGEMKVRAQDRAVVKRGRQINDDVRLAGFKADATLALAGHIMEGAAGLDAHRRKIAGDDPGLNMLLLDIETEAINGVRAIQRGFSGGFSL